MNFPTHNKWKAFILNGFRRGEQQKKKNLNSSNKYVPVWEGFCGDGGW